MQYNVPVGMVRSRAPRGRVGPVSFLCCLPWSTQGAIIYSFLFPCLFGWVRRRMLPSASPDFFIQKKEPGDGTGSLTLEASHRMMAAPVRDSSYHNRTGCANKVWITQPDTQEIGNALGTLLGTHNSAHIRACLEK